MSDLSFNVPAEGVTVQPIKAGCLHTPSAVRLDNHPLLVWAPMQWGNHIAVDGGAKVEDIAVAFAENPNPEAVAAQFGTVADAVVQAVNYAFEVGFLAPKGE